MMNTLLKTRPVAMAATVLTLVIAAGGAAVVGLHSPAAEANAPAAAAPAIPVSAAVVVQQPVAAWEAFSGRLEAVQRVDVRSRVAGAVQTVHFREGALVKAGELLITIDPAPYRAAVDRADAQVLAAQARAAQARSELERSTRLWQDKAIAQRELDENTHAAREAEANLRAAQAALQSAQLELDYTQVRAAVAGRVGRLEVTPGNLVAAGPGAPVLTTLVSVSPMYASFDADERSVAQALAELGPNRVLDRLPVQVDGQAARLQLVDNQVNAGSGTVRLRAVLENAEGALMPGQFVRVQLGHAKAEPALLVNERAIGTDQDKRFVWVIGADDTVQYREVRLGAAVDGLRVVRDGLKAGERIVVNGLQHVRPGAKVQPQTVEMTASTPSPAGGRGPG
jgi:multidrug efflux system membrane fusion protein